MRFLELYARAMTARLSVTLDEEHGQRLKWMAQQANVPEGGLASALLSRAIDDAEIDQVTVAKLLEEIPGIHERLAASEAEIERGDVISLDDL